MKWGEYANSACIVMLSAESAHRQDVLDPVMWLDYKAHLQKIVEQIRNDKDLKDYQRDLALDSVRAYAKQIASMVRW